MMNYHKDQKDNALWDKYREKLQLMKDVVDPRFLLEELGFSIVRETSKELRGPCLVHGGDNTSSFRFDKEKKLWMCFSHKCNEIYGGDVISLIRAIKSIGFVDAVNYLKDLTGEVSNLNYQELVKRQERESFIELYNDVKVKPKMVNETTLVHFKSMRTDYFVRHGIKPETLEHFEIGGGYVDEGGLIREVIPIRNDRAALSAYSFRDTRENVSEDNKYILTSGFEKDKVLYNMDKAQEYGDQLPIIVVEGFKSVWRLYECGIKNVVAIIGSSLTEGQQLLLYLYALKGVVLMFDNDEAGISGCVNACADLHGKLEIFPVFITEVDENGKGLDPADLSNELIYEYLDTYF